MTTREPLWRLMLDAVIDAIPTGSLGHRGFAAELRVIAGELFERFPDEVEVFHWILSEADRAERGEE